MPAPLTRAQRKAQAKVAPKFLLGNTHDNLRKLLTHGEGLFTIAKEECLDYDMRALQHCDAAGAVVLARVAFASRHPIEADQPERPEACEWLKDIGVVGRSRKEIVKQRPDTAPLRFLKNDGNGVLYRELKRLRDFLSRRGTVTAPERVRFRTVLSEVINNSFVHGGKNVAKEGVLICGQIHRRHMIVAATDWGCSIPGSLENSDAYRGRNLTDEQWIHHACQEGVTCGTLGPDVNLGTGLSEVVETVEEVGGALHIVSRRGIYSREAGADVLSAFPHGGSLDGTLIVADLR